MLRERKAKKIESKDQKDMLEGCKHSSNMLLNLINDLLDLAKQEKLTFQLNKSCFSLLKTIKHTFRTLEFLANKNDITMDIGVSKSDLKYFENLYGDKERYEQILLNIVSNALKFSDKGKCVKVVLEIKNIIKCSNTIGNNLEESQNSAFNITSNPSFSKLSRGIVNNSSDSEVQQSHTFLELLEAQGGPEAGKRDMFKVRFSLKVIDSGKGISSEGLKKMFVEFNTLDENKDQNTRGTGLGLSICKNIVEKMGGTIKVEST
jgi:signal transduction histidine kinase